MTVRASVILLIAAATSAEVLFFASRSIDRWLSISR
jgi:hypothetical protein